MVRSIPQLEALRDEWDALSRRFRSPLVDHDWFVSCAEAFHHDGDLCILTTREGNVLTGVAPLVREGGRLVLLGGSRLHEPCNWLFSTDDVLAELAEAALALGEPMILQRVPAASPVWRVFAGVPKWRAVTLVRPAADALAVSTRGSWDAYYESLSSHVTSNLRRLRRKAEKALGPMAFVQHAPSPAEAGPLFETVVSIEGSGWKGRRGSSLAAREDLRSFFRRYCDRAARERRLRVSTLSFGEKVAAVELSVLAYGRLWQLKIGYHDALAAYYPGLHLTEMSIRSAFEQGLDGYEFLGSAAPWEARWNADAHAYRSCAVYPMRPMALAGACRDAARVVQRYALGVQR